MERMSHATTGSCGGFRYGPVAVETITLRRPVDPAAVDAVRLLLIRKGALSLTSDSTSIVARAGELLLIRAATLCTGAPIASTTFSTLFIDPDYLFELWFWQFAPRGYDRHALRAHTMREEFLPAVKLLHPSPEASASLSAVYDGLARAVGGGADTFYRAQSLVSELIHIVTPFVGTTLPARTEPAVPAPGPSVPREREFIPLRSEARVVRHLLHSDMARHWTIRMLADEAHLSPRQFTRVFSAAFGKPPLVYLTMLRAREMARLLVDTDVTISTAARLVGWRSRSRAAEAFRQNIGISPDEYRSVARDRNRDMADLDRDALERTGG